MNRVEWHISTTSINNGPHLDSNIDDFEYYETFSKILIVFHQITSSVLTFKFNNIINGYYNIL